LAEVVPADLFTARTRSSPLGTAGAPRGGLIAAAGTGGRRGHQRSVNAPGGRAEREPGEDVGRIMHPGDHPRRSHGRSGDDDGRGEAWLLQRHASGEGGRRRGVPGRERGGPGSPVELPGSGNLVVWAVPGRQALAEDVGGGARCGQAAPGGPPRHLSPVARNTEATPIHSKPRLASRLSLGITRSSNRESVSPMRRTAARSKAAIMFLMPGQPGRQPPSIVCAAAGPPVAPRLAGLRPPHILKSGS
jgi:hypothetical protein